MVDRDLVLKKLACIETCVRELRTLARLDLLDSDIREERFVVHTLQLASQAALDVASHIVADERLGEPRTNLAGFRNIVVHGYETVSLAIVRDIVENRLSDLLAFVAVIRNRLQRGSE